MVHLLPHNLQQRADELRHRAHHAQVDGDSHRSAVLNRQASALEARVDATRRPALTESEAGRLRTRIAEWRS